MGRKRKEVINEEEKSIAEISGTVGTNKDDSDENINTIEPETQPTNKNTDKIKYTGTVSIKVKHGNRTIFSNKSHNEGGLDLFKFLAHCIAGDYVVADNFIPCKIMTFYSNAASPAEWKANSGNIKCSDFKFKEGQVKVENTTITETEGSGQETIIPCYSATIHFRLPFSWINGDSINVIGLYAKNASAPTATGGSVGDFAAVYRITAINDDGQEYWTPISTDDQDANLIIDWKLSILNK